MCEHKNLRLEINGRQELVWGDLLDTTYERLICLDCGKEVKTMEEYINILLDAMYNAPHPALIMAAMYLMTEYDRDKIPDWVAALAGGNPDDWNGLYEFVRGEIEDEYDALLEKADDLP